MKNKLRDGSLNKAARLIILMDLEDRKKLAGLSLQKIADMFDEPGLHRSTIMRDLNDLPKLRVELRRMQKQMSKKA